MSLFSGGGGFASGLVDTGSAVSALFGAKGARAAAKSYGTAQSIAEQNAALEEQATKIKEIQLSRGIFKTIGLQKAQIGGAGFAASGSALDLLRSSASEGALSKALVQEQGAITANSYREQASQFGGMKSAARSSATGQDIAALLNLGGAGFNFAGVGAPAAGGAAGTGAILDAGSEALPLALA